MITAKQLVSFMQMLIDTKAVYWYGTFWNQCTDSLYKSKKAQYPSHYTASRASGYKADIKAGKKCVDCMGSIKGAAWSNGGTQSPKYASNGCPDKSADDMFAWCKTKGMSNGKIASLPETPGVMLHKDGHAGVYIGGGWAIEARSFDTDVVKSKVSGRGWTGWAKLPFVDYSEGAQPQDPPYEYGSRDLARGAEGDDVRQLQLNLITLGYPCGKWGADGEFGGDTEAAVVAFQYDNGLAETGVVDKAMFDAIAQALSPDDQDDGGTSDGGDDDDPPAETRQSVQVTSGNTVNVRTAPTTSAPILGVAYNGDSFDYSGETMCNDWHRILFGSDNNAWISGAYTSIVDQPAPPKPPVPETSNPIIVDLSQHDSLKNAKNDWVKIKKNVSLLILRCGVTRTQTDPVGIGTDAEFAYAAKKCQEQGIPFGAYYYGKVKTTAKAREEAQMAYAIASPFSPLFYVYDVEESRLTNAIVEAWMDEIRKLGAKKVGLYIAHHMYPTFKSAAGKADFTWIPRYGKNTGAYDPKYDPGYPCDLHQYTSVGDGRKLGLADNTVDLNRLTGTKSLNWFLAE